MDLRLELRTLGLQPSVIPVLLIHHIELLECLAGGLHVTLYDFPLNVVGHSPFDYAQLLSNLIIMLALADALLYDSAHLGGYSFSTHEYIVHAGRVLVKRGVGVVKIGGEEVWANPDNRRSHQVIK